MNFTVDDIRALEDGSKVHPMDFNDALERLAEDVEESADIIFRKSEDFEEVEDFIEACFLSEDDIAQIFEEKGFSIEGCDDDLKSQICDIQNKRADKMREIIEKFKPQD